MENGIKMIFVSKWFLILVEYIDSKITIWPPDDISLINLCWVTINIDIFYLQYKMLYQNVMSRKKIIKNK